MLNLPDFFISIADADAEADKVDGKRVAETADGRLSFPDKLLVF